MPGAADELHRLGMPLNLDTLASQRRDDPMFSHPGRWTRFCQAGEQVEGAQAWGAFGGSELVAYVVLFRLGRVVNLLYQNSRTSMMKLNSNPALTFTVTQTMIRAPGIEVVYNGPEGLWGSKGLDSFKRRMGFDNEPVVFVMQLRSVLEQILLNWGGRRVISALNRWLPERDIYRRIEAVLDTASMSLEKHH